MGSIKGKEEETKERKKAVRVLSSIERQVVKQSAPPIRLPPFYISNSDRGLK
jgi:hypothetical protein